MESSNTPTKKQHEEVSKFTPEEIFDRINKIRDTFPEEPTILEQWFSAGKRDLARQISKAQSEALSARRELIKGLTTCISVYIDAHRADLKVRSSGYITATFTKLTGSLYDVNEQVLAGFLDSYSIFAERIEGNPKLNDEQKKELIKDSYRRAVSRINIQETSFNQILEQIRIEVNRMITEMGDRES